MRASHNMLRLDGDLGTIKICESSGSHVDSADTEPNVFVAVDAIEIDQVQEGLSQRVCIIVAQRR